MGTDIPASNHLLKLVDKGSLLTGLVTYWLCRLLLFHYKIYRKIPMMKTSTIVLSVLLFLGISIKSNALPTSPDSLVPPSTTDSASNCMMQVFYLSECQQICNIVPACKGYTYCSTDMKCFLKKDTSLAHLKDHKRCESGYKHSETTMRDIEFDS